MATAKAGTSRDERSPPGGLVYDGFVSYSLQSAYGPHAPVRRGPRMVQGRIDAFFSEERFEVVERRSDPVRHRSTEGFLWLRGWDSNPRHAD